MSALFIRRPVATILLAVGLAMAGLFGYLLLPVAALPQADYPTISVSAQLAGASPDTMATAVATPLIKQFQTIAGIDTITAQNRLGSTQIVLQFDLNRNIDAAAADVQSAIAAVARRLPPTMTTPPTYRKANPADAPILLLSLSSASLPSTEVDSFAENVIAPTISTISGVAEAQVLGGQTYAVRVDADPAELAARGLDMAALSGALAAANSHTPLGTIGNNDQTLTLAADTQRTDAAGFRSLIVSDANGSPVRLGDVAQVYDSVQSLQAASWYDGGRAIILAVMRQPGANTVAVVDQIRARLPDLQASLPATVSLSVMNDASTSIRNAVHDVGFTLALVVGLVMLVIFLFLGKVRATLVPGLAVPLSLLAACGGMYVLGFSIDNISLLALTLSVGLVVDDAIVMQENITRRVEAGEAPFAAALAGSREVAWTIVSMSASLIAVFIPLLLMGGVIGRLFNEFGMVVALAIAASALVSLTLTPMLAARLPAQRRSATARPGRFDAFYRRALLEYDRSVAWCLNHRAFILGIFAATIVGSAALLETLPTTFFPQEDTGQLTISTQARQDISFAAMSALQQQVAARVQASPAVDHVASSVGGGFGGGANSGSMFVQLKPKGERPDLATVVADLRRSLAEVDGVKTFILPTQSLRIGGRASRAQYQLTVEALTDSDARSWAGKLADAMSKDTAHFADVNTDAENGALQVQVTVDQDHATALGITAAAVRQALQAGFGGSTPATIETTSGSFDVILEYDPGLQWNDAMLAAVELKTANGALVPLSAIASISRTSGPAAVNQTGELPSVTVSFNLPTGVALGQATGAVDTIKASIGMPASIITAYGGTAAVFAQSAASELVLVAAAILTIYVVLGILYESFVHPLTILSGLPAASFGALLALKLGGFDLSVIALIGILMLIGIVKKNAIMMVDVALHLQRSEGVPAAQAIREACQRRFRPIMMTTFCALLGVLPIAIGTGASSELRQPLGVAVVGGLVISQLLTLFITPVIFVEIDGFAARLAGLAGLFRRPFVIWPRKVGPAPAE